jgi:ribosomal protein S18 acetylase RimI-like enzyme
MRAICLHDKHRIAAFLRRDPARNVYLIGDLDDFFWPYTQWYGLEDDGELREVALIYAGTALPVLLALGHEPEAMCTLLHGIRHLLPPRLYAHLGSGVLPQLAQHYNAEPHGEHAKMVLTQPGQLGGFDMSGAERLAPANLDEVQAFYRAAYPDGWFDPRMLETGQYFGVRQEGQLASIAGVHVYSPAYGVAAIGNVATRPELRGRGLATIATAALCRSLLEQAPHVGLNVRADNAVAIACYTRLGFETVAMYDEFMLVGRSDGTPH